MGFLIQSSTRKKGQNRCGNLPGLQSKQRRLLDSTFWCLLMEEKQSPAESFAVSVPMTRYRHNNVYLGRSNLNKAKRMATVVIIRVPGNKILCLSK